MSPESLPSQVLVLVLEGFPPGPDLTYLAIGAAILAGSLVTVPWRARGASSTLLLVPLIPAVWRYGLAAAPLLFVATAIAFRVRRAGWLAILSAGAADALAYIVAWFAGAAFPQSDLSVAVSLGLFMGLQTAARRIAAHYDLLPSGDPQVEQPHLALNLAMAPVGAIPVLAGHLLGDGGLLLALAGLLPLLMIAREWWTLCLARASAERERDRLELERRRQEELTDLIAHEVRNPLSIVIGSCQFARRVLAHSGGADPDEHLERVIVAARTIERLVENLLQLSRVEATNDQMQPVNLGVLAREVTTELRPLAEEKHQTIVVEVPDQAIEAQASPFLLREALSNLVSNAVKYTPEGGWVTVWAQTGPRPGTAMLGVTDTGVGLSEDDKRHLFTKFFRSADPRVREERGTGLGLALTHAIVEQMGGQIHVDSNLNEGATFRMLLPSPAQ